jgi:hypothetical protein
MPPDSAARSYWLVKAARVRYAGGFFHTCIDTAIFEARQQPVA